MSIHILIGYVANMMRHINERGLDRINLNLDYFVHNEKYAIRQLEIHYPSGNFPRDFSPEKFISDFNLPHYSIKKTQNKISIAPIHTITFFDFNQEVLHSLKLRLFDIQTKIYLNDLLVSTDTNGVKWTYEDENAYYLVSSVFDQSSHNVKDKRQHYFKELNYHLDKLVICNGPNRPDILDISVYGYSGIVVPKTTLLVKNDNLLNKLECPIWQSINSRLSSVVLKSINSWQRKNSHSILCRINKTILFNELTPMQLTSYQLLAVMDAPLFSLVNGAKINLLNLLKVPKVNFYLDGTAWDTRNENEVNYSIRCADFFGDATSNKNKYFVRLLNSPHHQTLIFLELLEKYINTISGCYKYKTAFSKDALAHLDVQRKAFQKNIKLAHKVKWIFHTKDGDVIYEFGNNGLHKLSKKIELAA